MKDESKLTEQDLFGTKEVEKPIKKKDGIPFYYIEVPFNSLGKLSTPATLHFRNFSANEAAKLATTTEDDEYKTFIECLNSMVYESFDCANLHTKELYTILYTLHASFFSNTIEKDFLIDESLEEPELSAKDNIDTAYINISDFKTKTLPKEFKEPITLTSKLNGFKASFILPRVGFALQAKEYLEEKYRKELMDFYDIKVAYEEIAKYKTKEKRSEALHKIPVEMRIEFEAFQRKYLEEYLVVINALCIQKVGSKTATNLKEHLKLVTLVDRTMQEQFNKVQKMYDFGIEEEVEYLSKKENKRLSRRFSFRFEDFVQSGENAEGDSGFDVSFG